MFFAAVRSLNLHFNPQPYKLPTLSQWTNFTVLESPRQVRLKGISTIGWKLNVRWVHGTVKRWFKNIECSTPLSRRFFS
ncbi:Uncharacterized protein HZ326_4244 [Fusarium oxysporum f. sp. albedinis]|nr:Uncharacterized protein HZ326_4244 [Fusarium oxysporum f. sp. albedinis]